TVLVSLRLRSKKRRGEQIRLQLSVANRIVPVGILPGLALGLDVFDGLFRHFLDVGRHRPESLPNGKRQSRLDAFPERLSLLLLETLGNAFVISRQGVISLVRDSFLRKPRVHQSNERIPAHDVRVEKRQWFPGFYRLNPKRRPAEFIAEGVEINPVD